MLANIDSPIEFLRDRCANMQSFDHLINKRDLSEPKPNFGWMANGSMFNGLRCLNTSMSSSIKLSERVKAGEFKRKDGKTIDDFQILPCSFVPHVNAIYSRKEADRAWRSFGWLNISPNLRPENWLEQQQGFNRFSFGDDFMESPSFKRYLQLAKCF